MRLPLQRLPLHLAIEEMDVAKVVSLLLSGADPNERDPETGFLALLAVDMEWQVSDNRFVDGDYDALPQATLTRWLFAAGADPDSRDRTGLTARGLATKLQHAEALALFRKPDSSGGVG